MIFTASHGACNHYSQPPLGLRSHQFFNCGVNRQFGYYLYVGKRRPGSRRVPQRTRCSSVSLYALLLLMVGSFYRWGD